jgi:type IV pilus assembly protein PilN
MTQINLLPWREQARNAKKIKFGLTALGYAGFAIFIVLIMHVYFASLIDHQEKRNAFLQSIHDQEQIILTQLNKKKKEQSKIDEDLKFLYSLRGNTFRAVQLFDGLARIVPEDVSFSKVIREAKIVTILGSAKSNLEVTQLMKNMANSPLFQQPDLTEISAKETESGDERNFQVKVMLRE